MEVVSSRDQSPALLAVPPTNTTHNHRKRKHAAAASVAASSPAPSSDRGDTPAPSTDNVSVPGRNDLATRPRLKISRHPSFVPIAPGSPYHTTELLCVNKLKFRYTPAGLSPEGATLPFRTIESAPQTFRVSWEDRSPFVKVTQDGLGLKGERGFRSARCNAPVREGKWYMEVKIDLGGGEIPPEWKKSEGGHVRLGWGRRESPLNGPAGSDGYSYAMRDKTGEKVHLSRPRPYGKPFKTGDVVGMYISLPPHREPNPKDPHDPAHIKRERIAIDVKSQEYFESYEYAQSEEMMALMEVNKTVPAPITTKKSATVKNLPSTSRGPQNTVPETPASRPLPTLGPDSYVAFFVNGECQGIAYQDLYDYLPLRTLRKAQEKKRSHREGVREHKENPFDDGSLGYYPLISLFNEARVKLNPGPDFEFPPPSDIDGLLTLNSSMDVDVKPGMTEHARTWRPLCERYPEYMAEQFALDAQEEEEATTQQQVRLGNHPHRLIHPQGPRTDRLMYRWVSPKPNWKLKRRRNGGRRGGLKPLPGKNGNKRKKRRPLRKLGKRNGENWRVRAWRMSSCMLRWITTNALRNFDYRLNPQFWRASLIMSIHLLQPWLRARGLEEATIPASTIRSLKMLMKWKKGIRTRGGILPMNSRMSSPQLLGSTESPSLSVRNHIFIIFFPFMLLSMDRY